MTEAYSFIFRLWSMPSLSGIFVEKTFMVSHQKVPRGNKDLECSLNKNIVAETIAILHQVFGKNNSPTFIEHIVSKIREDDIGQCALIFRFGEMLCKKYDINMNLFDNQWDNLVSNKNLGI